MTFLAYQMSILPAVLCVSSRARTYALPAVSVTSATTAVASYVPRITAIRFPAVATNAGAETVVPVPQETLDVLFTNATLTEPHLERTGVEPTSAAWYARHIGRIITNEERATYICIKNTPTYDCSGPRYVTPFHRPNVDNRKRITRRGGPKRLVSQKQKATIIPARNFYAPAAISWVRSKQPNPKGWLIRRR